MAEDFQEKTEEATQKKLSDSRKKGQVARSQDLTSSFILMIGVAVLFFFSSFFLERFQNLVAGILNNFKSLRLYGNKKRKTKLFNQDKGQAKMVKEFLRCIIEGKTLISFDETVAVTKATFAVLESIKTGLPIKI